MWGSSERTWDQCNRGEGEGHARMLNAQLINATGSLVLYGTAPADTGASVSATNHALQQFSLTHPVARQHGVQHAHEGAGVRHHVRLCTRGGGNGGVLGWCNR